MDKPYANSLTTDGSFILKSIMGTNECNGRLEDGLCIFDIVSINDAVDEASFYDFKVAARSLIGTCLSSAGASQGGESSGLGESIFYVRSAFDASELIVTLKDGTAVLVFGWPPTRLRCAARLPRAGRRNIVMR